jgi:hypothetical protein
MGGRETADPGPDDDDLAVLDDGLQPSFLPSSAILERFVMVCGRSLESREGA